MTRIRHHRIAALVVLVLTVGLAGCGVSESGSADYPTRTIDVVVPYPAGGGGDVIARALVESVNSSKALPERLQVVNRDGGAGVVGTQDVLSAKPDGYTLEMSPDGPITLQPQIVKVPYDPLKMTPIAQVSRGIVVLVVPGKSPYRTLGDLVKAAAKSPGSVSIGEGPPAYALPTAQLERAANIKFKHVDFQGDAASTTALLGGNVDASMSQPPAVLAQLRSGDLRALAVTGAERSPFLPDVPTLQESGYDIVAYGAYGVFGPDGIPDAISKKLARAFAAALGSKSFKKVAESTGLVVEPASGSDLLSTYRKRTDEVRKLAKAGLLS